MHLSATGGVVEINAGENGVRSEGTASIEIGGPECLIEGGENALRTKGNSQIDTDACGTLDLIGVPTRVTAVMTVRTATTAVTRTDEPRG